MNMKRLITITICTIVCMTTFGATVQRAILSHKGQLTQFDANNWRDAIEQAVAGDTVYFTSGYFSYIIEGHGQGEVVIDKPITLIGAGIGKENCFYPEVYGDCCTDGQSTIINANINIAIPGSKTLQATVLEGFHFPDYCSVYATLPVTNLKLKKIQLVGGYGGGSFSSSAKLTNLVLEDCYVSWLYCDNFDNPDIHNCYFNYIMNAYEKEFTNCTIREFRDSEECTLINCITNNCGYSTFINSIKLSYDDANNTYIDCWFVENGQTKTKADLVAGNYIGIDGSVVGPFGGEAPFMLIPSQPYVSSSILTYMKSSKKLNVNVTVKKGQ